MFVLPVKAKLTHVNNRLTPKSSVKPCFTRFGLSATEVAKHDLAKKNITPDILRQHNPFRVFLFYGPNQVPGLTLRKAETALHEFFESPDFQRETGHKTPKDWLLSEKPASSISELAEQNKYFEQFTAYLAEKEKGDLPLYATSQPERNFWSVIFAPLFRAISYLFAIVFGRLEGSVLKGWNAVRGRANLIQEDYFTLHQTAETIASQRQDFLSQHNKTFTHCQGILNKLSPQSEPENKEELRLKTPGWVLSHQLQGHTNWRRLVLDEDEWAAIKQGLSAPYDDIKQAATQALNQLYLTADFKQAGEVSQNLYDAQAAKAQITAHLPWISPKSDSQKGITDYAQENPRLVAHLLLEFPELAKQHEDPQWTQSLDLNAKYISVLQESALPPIVQAAALLAVVRHPELRPAADIYQQFLTNALQNNLPEGEDKWRLQAVACYGLSELPGEQLDALQAQKEVLIHSAKVLLRANGKHYTQQAATSVLKKLTPEK